MTKVLFIIKDRTNQYGSSFGLVNSAAFTAEALQDILEDVKTKVVTVTDGNSIDKEVHLYKPDIVIIEAIWVTPAKIEELCKLYKKTTWIVIVHSKAPFLAVEGNAMQWMFEYKDIAEKLKLL